MNSYRFHKRLGSLEAGFWCFKSLITKALQMYDSIGFYHVLKTLKLL